MNRARDVFNLLLLKRKRNSCTFSYVAPLPLFNVAELQFPTETIQFCTTLNKGGGESNEDVKSANLPNSFVYDCSEVFFIGVQIKKRGDWI